MGLDIRWTARTITSDSDLLPNDIKTEPHFRRSYGGFHHFRRRLAEHLGIHLDGMDGFGGFGRWENVPEPAQVFVPFLYHSDCDGLLSAEEVGPMVAPLREIATSWRRSGEDYFDIQSLESLADIFEATVRAGGTVLFR